MGARLLTEVLTAAGVWLVLLVLAVVVVWRTIDWVTVGGLSGRGRDVPGWFAECAETVPLPAADVR